MNASGVQYQTNHRCLHHYLWLPTEVFSASENSSQVSYREKFILHTKERFTWRFSFTLHEHRSAFFGLKWHFLKVQNRPTTPASCSQLRPWGSVFRSCSLLRYESGLMVTNKEVL